jgi:FMN-dependent NADH-azoreductase
MMAKVLYVQASPRAERSKSIQVADAFVKAYAAKHPSDKVETLNLFTANLPTFDGLTINGKYNIMHGKAFSPEEKKAWEAVVKVIEHFKSFDKYVLAVPMWNFGIPYRLKQYLDIIIQDRKSVV